MLTLWGAKPRESAVRQPPCADAAGVGLHAAVRVDAHDPKRLEQLCRCITRHPLSDERVKVNGAGQVELDRAPKPQPLPNAELFPTRQSEQLGWLRLLERLRARLGDEQVLQLQTVADHRPERASRAVPVGSGPVAAPPAAAGDDLPWSRPAWLLPEPQPLADRQAMPWFEGRPLQLLAGPERIETGWWDGGLATRDHFIAQAADGALLWVYRARLPVADEDQPLWFLQGWFG